MSGFKLYTNSHKRIWDFLHKEIERHKRTRKPDVPRDVMDVYLNVLESSDTKPESFSEDQLLATCMDMFMAGSETTSNTLSFCFLYLILNPEILISFSLPYVECVVMESLRMFGGRAFTVPHRALRDTSLSGYHIPKDVLVVGNLYGSMLQEGCGFDEPEKFRPERFLKNGKISLPDGFLPFGLGKHRCLGESLARANIFLFVATMMQKFTFSIVPEHPPTTEWSDGVTPGPRPFKARAKPRL
ncbi:unnamed protein product [Phaedon cochleariae]|uniref:Cytochrome P450 n=1 Tax=Phaedon cochleariae TaxID=80249 RepID=A0A9P0GXN1_PHACE|nr:unnamed protein product [Phaedon cochleariae]